MKRFTVYLAIIILSLLLCACGADNNDENTTTIFENTTQADLSTALVSSSAESMPPVSVPIVEPKEFVRAGELKLPEGSRVFKTLRFAFEGLDCVAEFYTTAQQDKDGVDVWDDANLFIGVISLGDKTFILFPEEKVQIGEPSFSIFESENGNLHVVLTDSRTAQYSVTEFIYDKTEQAFEKRSMWENVAVNFWGTI